jgi:hypothetical protein
MQATTTYIVYYMLDVDKDDIGDLRQLISYQSLKSIDAFQNDGTCRTDNKKQNAKHCGQVFGAL